MNDPTRNLPPTYEQWIETHNLDWSYLESPNPGSHQTKAARRASRTEELRTTQ